MPSYASPTSTVMDKYISDHKIRNFIVVKFQEENEWPDWIIPGLEPFYVSML